MSNIHKSLLVGRNQCKDLIYFVEDDYLHTQNTFSEIILTYERISSQINNELILYSFVMIFFHKKESFQKKLLVCGDNHLQQNKLNLGNNFLLLRKIYEY